MDSELIKKLRYIAITEGISFLVLLGVAMPLKYIYDQPLAVRIVGSAHGFLWLLFCIFLALAHQRRKWPLSFSLMIFVASVTPFGPFLADGRLKKEQLAAASDSSEEAI